MRATNPEGTGEWSESGTGSTHVNLPPAFTGESAAFSVAENETAVGTVQAVDANAEDSVTGYALTGGADRELFELDGASGEVRFKAPPNYEEPLRCTERRAAERGRGNNRVRAGGERHRRQRGACKRTAELAVTVTVTDVDEPPARAGARRR